MAAKLTKADRAYIRRNYLTLTEVCAGTAATPEQVCALIERGLLPRASYVLDDGSTMFPRDYLRLAEEAGGVEKLRQHFAARYRAACLRLAATDTLEEDWEVYLSGIYGVCLREVTPENIVRKGVLVASLTELLSAPRPQDDDWRQAVREQVERLDTLEREFAPDYDRSDARPAPPSRDLLVTDVRSRFPDVFAESSTSSAAREAVRIRRATADDLEAVFAVNRAAALAAYAGIFGAEPFPAARVRARYRRLLADPGCRAFLAEVDHEPVGFVLVRPSRLHSLYVSPSAWGRGVGSRLYEVAEPLLAADATLWVLEANARGREFWEHRGWRPDGERKLEHGRVELRYQRERTTPAKAGRGEAEGS